MVIGIIFPVMEEVTNVNVARGDAGRLNYERLTLNGIPQGRTEKRLILRAAIKAAGLFLVISVMQSIAGGL